MVSFKWLLCGIADKPPSAPAYELRPQSATAKKMPTMTRLPLEWNEEHDKFVCYCEALGIVPIEAIAKSLKQKFPQIAQVSLSTLAVERRIMALDEQLNDYFVAGMKQAILREEKAGNFIPPFDDGKYVSREGPQERDIARGEAIDDELTASAEVAVTPEALGGDESPVTGEEYLPLAISTLKPISYAPRGSNTRQRLNLVENDNDEIKETIREVNTGKENRDRDYIIPIRRPTPEGRLPPSGTSAILSRRAGLKDSGSLASLNYTADAPTSSAFDAVGHGLQIPRSESIPRSALSPGHGYTTPRSYLPRNVNSQSYHRAGVYQSAANRPETSQSLNRGDRAGTPQSLHRPTTSQSQIRTFQQSLD